MGYRSDVTIVMYPKRKEDFAALKLYADETFPDKFEVAGRHAGDKYLHCYIDGVKWYEGYEEVDVYTRAFSEWEGMFRDEEEPEAPLFHYEFIRIGEEYEDVVYDCSYGSAHALNMSRETYIDF
jgi:hypothetical protein